MRVGVDVDRYGYKTISKKIKDTSKKHKRKRYIILRTKQNVA